jgi:hypothetical protein
MAFTRPQIAVQLSKEEKTAVLAEYIQHYTALAASDVSALNRKLPKDTVGNLLDTIGGILLSESAKLADAPGPVRKFLQDNPVPPSFAPLLPDSVRAFCLALNALKQWVATEQVAMDRYVLGNRARELCRSAGNACMVTGETLTPDAELHHPVRDGRPPLLISKKGHGSLEGQDSDWRQLEFPLNDN